MINNIVNCLQIVCENKYLKTFLYFLAAVIICINIFLIWSFRYIPFQDHPSHLLRENVMLNYNNPDYDYSENFNLNLMPVPNILSDLIIVFLGKIFPIQISSKIFYTLYLVLFPLMFLFFLRTVDKRLTGYAFIAVFFLFSYFTYMGNENFILSLILFFAYWIMVLKGYFEKSLKHQILFIAIVGLLYFAHMFTFYIACVSTGIFFLLHKDIKNLLKILLFLIPFVILFFIWQFGSGGSIVFDKKLISQMFINSRKMKAFSVVFYPYLNLSFSGIILIVIGTVFVSIFLRLFYDVSIKIKCLFFSFLGILGHIFLPTTFLFFGPDQRAIFVAFLFGAVLLPVKKGIRIFFVIMFASLSIFSVTQNIKYFRESKEQLERMVPLIENMPAGKRILPVIFNPYTWVPFLHRIYEYYHLEKGGINSRHFFTKSNLVMYKDKKYKPPINPTGPGDYPEGFFDDYDIILIIGDKVTDSVMSYISFIRKKGFKTYCVNSRTLNALSK